jgi:hypothetical protein
MNLHSKLVLGVAAIALACGIGATAMAADQTAPMGPAAAAAPAAKPSTPLADVQKPKDALVGAKVHDNKGDAVGEVKAVKLGPDGKIASVDVNVGTKIVVLKADSLTYAETDKTLTSKQTKAEIQALNAM